MKKVLFSLLLATVFGGAMAQDNTRAVGGNGPQLAIDKEVHDYGTIAKGANGTCEFTVTNSGDQPLIITNCKGSCGCTVPKCDTAPIAPGKTSVITVKYDTNRPGPINKNVTITSNAVNAPNKVVRITGNVEAGPDTPTTPVKEQSPMAPVEKGM